MFFQFIEISRLNPITDGYNNNFQDLFINVPKLKTLHTQI